MVRARPAGYDGGSVSARSAFAASLLALAGAGAALGQGLESARISGRLADSAGKPLAYTTVWLVPADTARAAGAMLTDSAGGFAFGGLMAGEYYLRVDRPGFENQWSERKPLLEGQRLRLEVTSSAPPVAVAKITSAGSCRSGDEVAADTPLATLWREARKAATARRLADLSYRYEVDVWELLEVPAGGPGRYPGIFQERKAQHRLTSTPELARALASQGSYAGYGVGLDSLSRLVAIHEMLQVLDANFARRHCLYVLPDRGGRRRIHFQPLAGDTANRVAGNIELDERYRLRRIEFEYQRSDTVAYTRGFVNFGAGRLRADAIPFAELLQAWVFDGPASPSGAIRMSPPAFRFFGAERARAWVEYRDFRREQGTP